MHFKLPNARWFKGLFSFWRKPEPTTITVMFGACNQITRETLYEEELAVIPYHEYYLRYTEDVAKNIALLYIEQNLQRIFEILVKGKSSWSEGGVEPEFAITMQPDVGEPQMFSYHIAYIYNALIAEDYLSFNEQMLKIYLKERADWEIEERSLGQSEAPVFVCGDMDSVARFFTEILTEHDKELANEEKEETLYCFYFFSSWLGATISIREIAHSEFSMIFDATPH